jgi:hypothetical protein
VRSIYHFRTDGSVVAMTSISNDYGPDGKPRRDGAPLSFDQLTVLVTDPAMKLTG